MSAARLLLALTLATAPLGAEPPVIREGHGDPPELLAAIEKARLAGALLPMDRVREQLARKTCQLTLPAPATQPLAPREVWQRARAAHVRVGWTSLCAKCDHWHLNIAGGYFITADGVVATCHHVVAPKQMRDGYLVAVTDAGALLSVTEVLAASKFTDSCLLRVKLDGTAVPLPLCTTAMPGDDVWCYSDPLDHAGYFSKGIVNRFVQHWHGQQSAQQFPQRINVSTDWAPGSSGAAVLDQCGNAIGHVSEISAHGSGKSSAGATAKATAGKTLLVLHSAVRAADVRALVAP